MIAASMTTTTFRFKRNKRSHDKARYVTLRLRASLLKISLLTENSTVQNGRTTYIAPVCACLYGNRLLPRFFSVQRGRPFSVMSKQHTSYSEKLRDPRWQKMRLEIMERDKFTCCHCGDSKKTLNVHHLAYAKGAAPWEYDPSNLITLCEDCHELAEERITKIRTMAGGRSDYLMKGLCRILHAQAAIAPYDDALLVEATEAFLSFLEAYEKIQTGGAVCELVGGMRRDICRIAGGLHQSTENVAEGF